MKPLFDTVAQRPSPAPCFSINPIGKFHIRRAFHIQRAKYQTSAKMSDFCRNCRNTSAEISDFRRNIRLEFCRSIRLLPKYQTSAETIRRQFNPEVRRRLMFSPKMLESNLRNCYVSFCDGISDHRERRCYGTYDYRERDHFAAAYMTIENVIILLRHI